MEVEGRAGFGVRGRPGESQLARGARGAPASRGRQVEPVRTSGSREGRSGAPGGRAGGPGEARLPLATRCDPRQAAALEGFISSCWLREPHAQLLAPDPSLLPAHARLPARSAPTMADIQTLVGRWRLVESQGFDEYMKELGEALGRVC